MATRNLKLSHHMVVMLTIFIFVSGITGRIICESPFFGALWVLRHRSFCVSAFSCQCSKSCMLVFMSTQLQALSLSSLFYTTVTTLICFGLLPMQGPVHAYVGMAGGVTSYLSELHTGSQVMVVDSQGRSRTVLVGRVKIESRPLLLVEVEVEGQRHSVFLQNSDTVCLVTPGGKLCNVLFFLNTSSQ